MFQLADAVPTNAFSKRSKASARLAYAFVRTLVSTTKPEAYAAACLAIADATDPDYSAIRCPTLVLHGAEDPLSNAATNERYSSAIKTCQVVTLNDVGHWHAVEDPEATAKAIAAFL
jgi:pimeloyl-ACP methyl ester carboxylesterase